MRHLVLILLVLCAFAVGIRCSVYTGAIAVPLVRIACRSSVSTVRLLYSSELPFLVAIFAVLYSKPLFLIPLCFFKSVCFSFCLACVYTAFGSAAWLVIPMLMLSSAVSLLLFLRFSLSYVTGFRDRAGMELGISMAFVAGISFWDSFFVAPFLSAIMNY